MNQHGELLEVAVAELRRHGIRPQVRQLNGGHIEIAWQVVPEKEVRKVVTTKSGSDFRARMNIRAEVRRNLRADNVTIKRQDEPRKKHGEFARAMDLPKHEVAPIPDQISTLQAEMADLTEFVVALGKMMRQVRDTVTALAPPPATLPPPAPVSSRSVRIAEYLTPEKWISLSALERDTGLSAKQVKLKLGYLERQDAVVVYRGQAKLKKPPAKVPPKKRRGRPTLKSNGHHHAAPPQ
jgi:hypothetical protein